MIDFSKINILLNHVRRTAVSGSVLKAAHGSIFEVAKRYKLILDDGAGAFRLNEHLR